MSINESEFRNLLDRYLDGRATDEERKVVDAFFASYAEEHPGEDAADLSARKKEIFRRVSRQISSQRPFYFKTWFAAAAAVLLIVVSLFVFQRNANDATPRQHHLVAQRTESAKRGQKLVVDLPDGSRVHLNANSTISYPLSFAETRAVSLQGEAFFEVAHDSLHPFTVQARTSSVRVLGTVFNVNASNTRQVEVTLVTGKVNVSSGSKEVGVEPGYQAVVNNVSNDITKVKVDVSQFVSWKDNVLVFRETPLEEAVVILENWYDAKIDIKSSALKTCRISGQYKGESLENVIRSFEFLLQADARFINERTISFSGKGCKV